jgi:hypothetical protein
VTEPAEAASEIRSASEIRAYFLEMLEHAVLRPGMYGGELGLRHYLGDLEWICRREGTMDSTLQQLGAWTPIGVRGAFERLFGDGGRGREHDQAVGMVYGQVAWSQGFLAPPRTLTAGEYARLRGAARSWTQRADRVLADVIAEYGEPSLRTTTYNPRYPQTVAYVSASHADPLVVFDFWQDWPWDGQRVPRLGPEPVLRNVRWHQPNPGSAPDEAWFAGSFTFTPVGQTLLVPEGDAGAAGSDEAG